MNTTSNIYKNSFLKAIASAICLVISMFLVYSFSHLNPPNLLILGLMSFGGFYLVYLIGYFIKEKHSKKQI